MEKLKHATTCNTFHTIKSNSQKSGMKKSLSYQLWTIQTHQPHHTFTVNMYINFAVSAFFFSLHFIIKRTSDTNTHRYTIQLWFLFEACGYLHHFIDTCCINRFAQCIMFTVRMEREREKQDEGQNYINGFYKYATFHLPPPCGLLHPLVTAINPDLRYANDVSRKLDESVSQQRNDSVLWQQLYAACDT